MNCNNVQEKIEVYLDSELTLSDRRELEEHLADCKHCQAHLDRIRTLSESIKKTDYLKIPFSLRRKIKNDLKDITGEEASSYSRFQLLSFGISSAVLASCAVWAVMTITTSPIQSQLINELTEAHVRSLMVDHATDIASSDNHTVKPWFNGKLDFSPPVKNLKNEDFRLIGGRLDYLQVNPSQQKPAAALIYKRRSHYINVFIYRTDNTEKISTFNDIQNQSYNLINWRKQGLNYWAVSDLNAKELKQFAQLLGS